MSRLAGLLIAAIALICFAGLALAGRVPLAASVEARSDPAIEQAAIPSAQPALVESPPKPPPPPPMPSVEQALRSGVLIVVSKTSQKMYVFRDGEPWQTAQVSTGRRGHTTPSGVFPILQKQTFHRSNIYSNAPMPFMQRLTWSGIAIHAGHQPGYPASHGCIRVPYGFAKALYGLTRTGATTVVVLSEATPSLDHARRLALSADAQRLALRDGAVPPRPVVDPAPREDTATPPPAGQQTIQLAAALSPAEAEAHWDNLVAQRPELARFSKSVIPALVGSRQYYRLRATAPDAHAACSRLKSAGIACFNVL